MEKKGKLWKNDRPWRKNDSKEGGMGHRVETNTVGYDRVKRGRLPWCRMDDCRIGVLKGSRRGVREHLLVVCGTLHLTLQHCEFVRGTQAEELLTVISSCQLGSVSHSASQGSPVCDAGKEECRWYGRRVRPTEEKNQHYYESESHSAAVTFENKVNNSIIKPKYCTTNTKSVD